MYIGLPLDKKNVASLSTPPLKTRHFDNLVLGKGALVDELAASIPNVESVLKEKLLGETVDMVFFGGWYGWLLHGWLLRLLGRVAAGDIQVEMELLTACMAKDEKYNPRDTSCPLFVLMQHCLQHVFFSRRSLSLFWVPSGVMQILNACAPQSALVVSDVALETQAKNLNLAEFELLKEEISYDERCFDVHRSKLGSYEVRVAHLRDMWSKKRVEKAKEAVNSWWSSKVQCGRTSNRPVQVLLLQFPCCIFQCLWAGLCTHLGGQVRWWLWH